MTATGIDDYVVLLDERGQPVGQQRKSTVHHQETPLHLAFSLYLFDADRRLLMTRRALGKVTWPGVWTNTCCGHPRPDEPMHDAISRRLDAELGLEVTELDCVLPDFAYRTRDVGGVWENEICPVFTGRIVRPNSGVRPDRDEVIEWAWTDWDDVVTAMTATAFAFSPWAVPQVRQMCGMLRPARA